MTAGTLEPFCLAVNHIAINGRRNVFVTATTGVFGDLVIEPGDFNVVGIAAAGEIEGMPKPIIGFDQVLADEVVGRVAIVARSRMAVARFNPAVILCPHDMAVHARGRIVGQIGIAFGVDESIEAQTEEQPEQDTYDQSNTYRLHSRGGIIVRRILWRRNFMSRFLPNKCSEHIAA